MESTQFVVSQTSVRISNILETFFSSVANNKEFTGAIRRGIKTLGIDGKIAIVLTKQYLDKHLDPIFIKICILILTQFQKSFTKNYSVSKDHSFEAQIITIFDSPEFKRLILNLKAKLQECIQLFKANFVSKLSDEVSSKDGMDFNQEKTISAEMQETGVVKEKTTMLLQTWENHLKDSSRKLIEEKVKIPLDFENEKQYQQQLNSIILGAYSKIRKQQKLSFETLDSAETTAANNSEDNLLIDFKKQYFSKLHQLQHLTRDPEIFVSTIMESAIVDAFEARHVAQIIGDKLEKPVVIRNADREAEVDASKYVDEFLIKQNGINFKIKSMVKYFWF